MLKIQQVTSNNSSEIEISIVNSDDHQVYSLRSSDFRVEVKPHSKSTATRELHCGFIKTLLEGHFWNATHPKRGLFTGGGLTILPQRVFSIKLSTKELVDYPSYFKESHQFLVTLWVKESKINFPLNWEPQSTPKPIPPPIPDPVPPTDKGKNIMLEYQGTKPFYLNPTKTNTLKLCLSGNEQNQWLDISSSKLGLNKEVVFNAEVTAIGLDATHLGKIKETLTTARIAVEKRKDDSVITLNLNRTDQVVLRSDTKIELKIYFNKGGEKIECAIPTVLQRPAFLGHAALDFGTTNSSCAYYDPDKGAPDLPDRHLSPLQLQALRETLDSLMKELEDQTMKDSSYKILETRLIGFAQKMWSKNQGSPVKSSDDIRRRFESLKQQGVNEADLGEWRSKLLVSWGIHNYDVFRKTQPAEITHFLSQKYCECLNRIIDIDTQVDAKIFLPELEKGRKDGTLSSAVLMDELSKQEGGENKSDYPPIDPFQSKIKMGVAVDIAMKDFVQKDPLPREKLLTSAELHNAFITGVKRNIGQKELAYFADLKGQLFNDTYDPLCTVALKHLRTLAELSITADGSKCLSDLVITYPTNLPQHRRLRLKEMVQSLGVRDIDLSFDEATAGALYHVWRELLTDIFAGIDGFLARSHVRKETRKSPRTNQLEDIMLYFQNILFYDMGGGTTDIALLEIALEELNIPAVAPVPNRGRYFVVRPRILGLTGRDNFAGDNVTLAVFRILKSKLATKVANLLISDSSKKTQRSPAIKEVIEEFEAPQNEQKTWFTQWFTNGDSRDYDKVKAAINTLVTTRFRDKAELQPIFFEIWKEAERIKQALSTVPLGYEQIGLPKAIAATGEKLLPAIKHLNLDLQDPELNDIQVSAAEMERVIRQDVKNTFEKARNLCIGQQEGNQAPMIKYFIDRVILGGSSSHLRLIREEMPAEILGKPFQYIGKDGRNWNLLAPFKLDNHNLVFDAKESKLAVARGACLPRYFKTTRTDPRSPHLPGLLKEGVSFIDFDIDNLRHYLPFSLAYSVGTTGRKLLFLAGDRMNVIRRDGSIVAREFVAAEEILRCYRIENVSQLNSSNEEGLYCQFDIYYAIAEQAGLDKDKNKEQVKELGNQYLFFMEFDIERNLKCWMYFNPEGNTDPRYINQTAELSDKKLKPAVVLATFCERSPEGGQWIWKANPILRCPIGMSGQEAVSFKHVSPTELEGKVAMRQVQDGKGGIIRFEAEDGTLLWTVNLRDYPVNTPEKAELRIRLKLQNDQVVLNYTVYDPDLEDLGNNNYLREIKMEYDERRRSLPFNPFGGDE